MNNIKKLLSHLNKEELQKIINLTNKRINKLESIANKIKLIPKIFHNKVASIEFESSNDLADLTDSPIEYCCIINLINELRIYSIYESTEDTTQIIIEKELIINGNNKCGYNKQIVRFSRNKNKIEISKNALNLLDYLGIDKTRENNKMLGILINNLVYYTKQKYDNCHEINIIDCGKTNCCNLEKDFSFKFN